MTKDIDKYWDKYKSIYSFEEFSAIYREIKLLKSVSFRKKNVIEIGCGFKPLFIATNEYSNYIAIEPGKKPFEAISDLSKELKNVKVINSTFEKWCMQNIDFKADLIIFPGVLHEVNNPAQVLERSLDYLNPGGHIYINVPNVESLHRKLAVAMGIIKETHERSSRNIELEQNFNFSTKSLNELILNLNRDLEVIKLETFFLKPFTHSQMLSMYSNKIIDQKVIEGLYNVSEQIDDIGSEIACVVKYN